MDTPEIYMQRCLNLARLGAGNTAPNPMVGAVLVYNNTVIGEGYHQQYGGPHAEVNCINSVSPGKEALISKATLYVSLEPCSHFGKTPPCADLIIRKGIPRVVVGCRDPFEAVNGKGIEKLKQAGIEVIMSALEKECIYLNRRFFTFHLKKRPYIILKWAQTANGKIAAAGEGEHSHPEKIQISAPETNRLVHRWRSQEAAILIGRQTAIVDNPILTNRLWTGNNPIRMVLDANLSVPRNFHIYDNSAPTLIFNSQREEQSGSLQYVRLLPDRDSLPQLMDYSYRHSIQSILVEGGPTLQQSFLNSGLWDECRIITNASMHISGGPDAPDLPPTLLSRTVKVENDRIDFLQPLSTDAQ